MRLDPEHDPADGAPPADRARWPVVHPSGRRRVLAWRAVAVLIGALVLVRLAGVRGIPLIEVPALVLHLVVGAWVAVLLWRWAAEPVPRRADAAALNPASGALRDEKLSARMRREIRRDAPLAPELRRPAAVHVTLHTRYRAAFACALAGLAVPTAGPDVLGLAFGLVWVGVMLPALLWEVQVVRAAVAHGAVPRVAGVTPAAGPPPRR